jgi:hypothetical protein
MSATETDEAGTLAGKTAQVVYPHVGYRRVVKVITGYFGMTQQEWMISLVQAGILAAIEADEELSRRIRVASNPVWEEVTEMGKDESGTAGGMAAGTTA